LKALKEGLKDLKEGVDGLGHSLLVIRKLIESDLIMELAHYKLLQKGRMNFSVQSEVLRAVLSLPA